VIRENFFTDDLLSNILINPAREFAELNIISGYGSSAMAFHHMQSLKNSEIALDNVRIHLLVGMVGFDGISEPNHNGFVDLMLEFGDKFICSYYFGPVPVHSKVYVWGGEGAGVAFAGSANYSQRAFLGSQKEAMASCSPKRAKEYFSALEPDSIFCTHQDAAQAMDFYANTKPVHEESDPSLARSGFKLFGLEMKRVTLINNRGVVGEKSSLNWGHRGGRNRNEAYIPLKQEIAATDFFPPKKSHFTVNTDDGKVLICTRAQGDYGKAIETPHNNALLGEYFRNRLTLSNGEFVTRKHLEDYGRTEVDFYKVDNENFYLDFGVPSGFNLIS